jgi:hypothetical protein
VSAAERPSTLREASALVPTQGIVKQHRRRLAEIVSGYGDSSDSDGQDDSSEPSPSFFVHASALFYRMVLSSGGSEFPRDVTLTEGSCYRLRINVRLMSEYNRFRRADLEAHLPLSLSARLLTPASGLALHMDGPRSSEHVTAADATSDSNFVKLNSRNTDGFIDGSGRGMLDVVLQAVPASGQSKPASCGDAGASADRAIRSRTTAIEIELFVQGAVSTQILPVLTPTLRVTIPEPSANTADSSNSQASGFEAATSVVNETDAGAVEQDGTRAGTRHVLPVPVPIGAQGTAQPVHPLGLYITELTGAHVRDTQPTVAGAAHA